MAAKKSSSAMEFIVDYLKKHRNASYADVKSAADAKRLKVFPIMYGRAQTMLGIVKAKPRGQGKAARAKAGKVAAAGRRGPGRPRKDAGGIDAGSLDGIIAAVKSSEQDKARYRNALEKIQSILGSALG